MVDSTQLMLMRVFIPAIFLALMEIWFFFKITRADILSQVSLQYDTGNLYVIQEIRELERVNPAQAQEVRDYLRSVNENISLEMDTNAKTKDDINSKSWRNSWLIVAGLVFIVLYFWYKVRKTGEVIPWKSILIQTSAVIVCIGAFQYWFYLNVGRKYSYTSEEEIRYSLQNDLALLHYYDFSLKSKNVMNI